MPSVQCFDRLRATSTFADGAHDRWRKATLAVVGLGALGGHFAREAVRSGARCELYDFDVGGAQNLANQHVEVGEPKADTTGHLCNEIAPGSTHAYVSDVRHVGVGAFQHVALVVDCTDDPGLALPLTEISNGWGIPLLRLAVDGSGRLELGRVLVSDGGQGHACQVCDSSWGDVFDPGPRTPCVGSSPNRAPTNAGSALAMSITGFGLLCAQRLVGGNGADRTLDQVFFFDLDTPQILPMRLRRSETCLSGHRRWHPTSLNRTAADTTVRELFAIAGGALNGLTPEAVAGATNKATVPEVTLGFHGHPVLLGVTCATCDAALVHPGTLWRAAPPCPRCGDPMQRRRDAALDELNESQAVALGLFDVTCEALGLPTRGALVFARAPGHAPLQLLFP